MKQIKAISSDTEEKTIKEVNKFTEKLKSSNEEVIDIVFSTYNNLFFYALVLYDDKKADPILDA